MNDPPLHPLAADYLERLKKTAQRLTLARRAELLGEIEAHLREALPVGASEAEAREVLERLGEPGQIVAEAESESGQPVVCAGLHEWLAIPLLLLGGFILVFGWFVGLVLLWTSRVWTLGDKLIGALVVPGGLALAALLATSAATTTGVRSSSICTAVQAPRPGQPVRQVTEHCAKAASGGGINLAALVLLIVLAVLPVLTSIYLARRLSRFASA